MYFGLSEAQCHVLLHSTCKQLEDYMPATSIVQVKSDLPWIHVPLDEYFEDYTAVVYQESFIKHYTTVSYKECMHKLVK